MGLTGQRKGGVRRYLPSVRDEHGNTFFCSFISPIYLGSYVLRCATEHDRENLANKLRMRCDYLGSVFLCI